jgi:hypothetical protein
MTLRRFAAGLPEEVVAVKLDAAIAANVKELGYGG